MIKILHANSIQERNGVTILQSDKINFYNKMEVRNLSEKKSSYSQKMLTELRKEWMNIEFQQRDG